ncbi:MAG: hypothetical protein ACTSPB_25435 [Candidatus Thorarchaeota archaeon]
MIHGLGKQKWLRSQIESTRNLALEKRSNFTDDELDDLEVSFPYGGGRTDPDTFTIWQSPFPEDERVRSRKYYDLRAVKPDIGGY